MLFYNAAAERTHFRRTITSFNLQARFSQEPGINVPIALAWELFLLGIIFEKECYGEFAK